MYVCVSTCVCGGRVRKNICHTHNTGTLSRKTISAAATGRLSGVWILGRQSHNAASRSKHPRQLGAIFVHDNNMIHFCGIEPLLAQFTKRWRFVNDSCYRCNLERFFPSLLVGQTSV